MTTDSNHRPAPVNAAPPPTMEGIVALMAALRTPNTGCPWDLAQDFDTIAPFTIEEAYEVAEAIANKDFDELKAELGDLLFQVAFHARMAQEAGHFSIDDVYKALVDKMVRRHPHIFGDADAADSPQAQKLAWEELKAQERAKKAQNSALDDVPAALPALKRAQKLTQRAARVGFDWPDAKAVMEKLAEETAEVHEALASGNIDHIEDEIGDLMFVAANLARKAGLDAEATLAHANRKFERRFRGIEQDLAAQGLKAEDQTLDALEALWVAQKGKE